jgi:ankyrin repeat protein
MDISQLETLIETDKKQEISDLLTRHPELTTKETSHGVSPVLLACYYKKPVIAGLIAGFSKQITLFEACALGKFQETADLVNRDPELINSFSRDGFTPLGLAAYFGHEEISRLLISKGASVNTAANNGFNVFPIHSAVAARSYNITKMLLEAGAEVNVKQQAGFTALHAAAQTGNIEMIVLLLEYAADLNVRMEGGKLPADLAEEKGFAEIAAILKI